MKIAIIGATGTAGAPPPGPLARLDMTSLPCLVLPV